MLYFNRVDVSEGVEIDKTTDSHEYIFCQFHYF